MVAIPTGALEGLGQYMFALGHKQIRSAIVMSALPRKTDILCAERNVR
jgi:hypothetical protein